MKKKLLFLVVLAMVLSLVLASCVDRKVTGLEIMDGTFKYEYEVGETVDLSGLKVKASYSDGSFRELTADKLSLGTIDTATTGTKQFTISFEGYNLTVDVSVVKELTDDTPEATLSGIAIDASSVLTKVKVGDTYSTEGIRVNATYSDGTTKALTAADLTVSSIDTTTAGTKTLTVAYGGKSSSLTVTVLGVKSIQVFGAPASIEQDATLDTSGITAIITYTDDSVQSVSAADLTFGAFDTATAGAKELTVSYLDGSTTVSITVVPLAELIGIDVNTTNINAYITGIPDGTAVDTAAIKAGVIVYLNYGYAGSDTVVRTETLTDNSSLTVTELEEGGKRYVNVAYGEFNKRIEILETEAVVTGIAIASGSFKNYVILEGAFDSTGLVVNATLSNGGSMQIPVGTTGLELSAIDTASAGTKTLTATYGGFSAQADVFVLPVSQIVLNGTPDLRAEKGGSIDYSALTFTVYYSNGTYNASETVAIADMTVGAIDTATAGNKTFTVSYKGGSCSVAYVVKEVSSIALKQPAVTKIQPGEFDEDSYTFIITWSDGSTTEATKASGVSFSGTAELSTPGTHTVTVSYLGVNGSFEVNVNDYIIMGVTKPASLTALENKSDGSLSSKIAYFLDHSDTMYVVGDDNPFYFTLRLLVLDENDNEVTITNYTSASQIYIVEGSTERLLEGDEYNTYIESVDETKNAFDFKEAAVGKTFKIATRPAVGLLESEYATFTRTHTFRVVNAWNIYTPKELNILTNYNDESSESGKPTQVELAHTFLDTNGIARPSGPIAGIVLHNDLDVKVGDIPRDYLIDTGLNDAQGNDILHIFDGMTLYPHSVDYLNTATGKYEFTFYGNYYTIFTYGVPLVNADPTLGNEVFGVNDGANGISNSQVFAFDNDAVHALRSQSGFTSYDDYDNENYVFNMENLYMMDDDPNNPTGTAEESARAMRGLIGMKMRHIDAYVNNIVIERYYISFFPDQDHLDVELRHGKLYNAWQNHIFIFGDNRIQSYANSDHTPTNPNININLDIFDSEITVCGGPVIISQTKATYDDGTIRKYNIYSSPDVKIDENTTIYTFVQSSAAWFQAFNSTAEASMIEDLNAVFKQGYGHSYRVGNPLSGYTGDFMNIIMLNMTNGYSAGGTGADIDGTLTIGDTVILNMDDSNLIEAVGALMMQGIDQATATEMVLGGHASIPYNDGNLGLDAVIAGGGSEAPIFQSTAGTSGPASVLSTAYYNGSKLVGLTGDVGASHGIFGADDNYLTLYFSGMGIVFGDFHAHTGTGDGFCK